jgi:TonB-dependent starch-binding outer membrane protein SusC
MTPKNLLKALVLPLLFCFSQAAWAQDKVVTGKITDSKDGSPVAGVSIQPKGSQRGTTSAADGSFRITVPQGTTVLVFSSVGYNRQELDISGKTAVDVSLVANNTNLNEVVVVGYGTRKKGDLTGSVARIAEKDLNQGPITNPLQQLSGRAAGVNITQVGSEPGVAPSIRIRGITSLIGGNDPLVVVDGIQGNLDLLNQVPPSEIESVDILKDASATAIYGSRGAPGVILVTTKRGKAGKTTLEYAGTISFESIAKKYEVLNASEWRAEAAKRGIASSADFGGNTDWFDEVTRNGLTQNHNIAFGGGVNSFNYRASLTAILQDGIVINSGFKNYIGRFQATQKMLDNKLSITMNLNSSIIENRWNGPGVVQAAFRRRPTDPVYAADGSYFIDPLSFGYTNPYARAKEMIDGRKANSLFGSFRADLEIVKGVTASWFGSWRKTDATSGSYASPKTTREDARNQKGIANRTNNLSDERLTNASLNYKKVIGDHNIDVIGVYEWQQATYEGFFAQGRGFLNDFNSFNALQSADITKASSGDISSYKNDQTLVSFLGRANYSYKNKYLLTASFRRDGSSKFGANNKWANFPSVNVAWRITQESFMDRQRLFNDLKLRLGYGVTGNQQGLGSLNSVRLVGPNGTTFFGGNLIPDFSITQNENKDLKWETRSMTNVGIDFTMLKSRLSGTIDYFFGETKDLLFGYNVPQPPYPFPTIIANVGTVKNQGVELTLNYLAYKKGNWTVNLGGNFTSIKTEVTELSGTLNGIDLRTDTVRWGAGGTTGVASTNNGIAYLIKGQPLGTFMLFKHAGVDAFGNQIIEDLNGNGKIDDNDRSNDRYIAGQALPKFTYAFTPSISYKNLDLSMVWRGAYGNKIYNVRRAELSAMGQFGQANVLKEGIENNINNIDYASDFWLENGSYLRFDNLTVGYRFNVDKWKFINGLRASFTANNILVISDYKGIDPEQRLDGGNSFGIDYGIFPRTRTFAFGVNVSFR